MFYYSFISLVDYRLSAINVIVAVLFFICWAYQIAIYFFVFRKSTKETNSVAEPLPPVSVIVAARNEENNLRSLLPLLLNQKYPDFEIIVADDRSSDGTQVLVEAYSLQSKKIRYNKISETTSVNQGKKHALTVGIEHAINNALLFIDADCIPSSENWILQMASCLKGSKEIVLGYGAYTSENTFINDLIRYDAAFIGMQYTGFAIAGMPYMGVGRNLMYTKDIWLRNNGFQNHLNLLSGDDDLFVQQVADSNNTAVQILPDAVTYSKPAADFKSWCVQKARHLSTSFWYQPKIQLLLVAEPITRAFCLLSTIVLVFTLPCILLPLLLIMWLFKELLALIILIAFLKKAGQKIDWIKLLLFNSIMPFIYIFLWGFKRTLKANYHWK